MAVRWLYRDDGPTGGQNSMTSGIPVLWAVLLFVALQVVYALLIRTFPDFLGAALLKKIEQHNAAEIEKLKNDQHV